MATDIKRVRFFDGQFLKEGDFQAEQSYHSHLRRRMNFLLFGQSGVVPMTPTDLTLEVVSAPDKTFRVKAGLAIGQNANEQEGRELILAVDSAPVDLDSFGLVNGQVAVVTLHYEEAITDLSTEGEVSQETRVQESAVIHVNLAKPATTPEGDPFVQLGTIDYQTMAIATTGREVALLRSALIAAAPVPTITNVTGTTSAASGSVTMNIIGTNLQLASSVTFLGDAAVTVPVLGLNTGTSLTVTVNVGVGAIPGQKGFQLSTPSGISFSPAGVFFTVLTPPPTITGVIGTPTVVVGGAAITMTVTGSNLTGATVTFPGAAGVNVVPATTVASTGSVTFQVQAVAPATASLKTFHIATVGGTADSVAPVGLTVLLKATVTSVSGVTSIVANGVATPGIVLNGSDLGGASVVFTDPNVTVSSTVATASTVTLTLTAALGTTPALKTFTVTTLAGPADITLGVGVTVTAPVPAPTITAVSPATNSTPRPLTLAMTLTGTHLTGANAVVVSGLGITTNSIVVVSDIKVTVNFAISGSAAGGARTITISTPGGGSFTTSLANPATAFSVTEI